MQTASTLGGGVSPVVAAALSAAYGGFPPVAFYIMATFVVSLVIVWLAKEGVKIDLHNVGSDTLHHAAD